MRLEALGFILYRDPGYHCLYANVRRFHVCQADRSAAKSVSLHDSVNAGIVTKIRYRQGDTGKASNSTDNAWMIGGTYLLLQNVQLQLNHTEYSGSAYKGAPKNGDRMTTLMLYTSF